MRDGKTIQLFVSALLVTLWTTQAYAGIGSFDDISFWVGEGANEAALVIEWGDDKGKGMVWGYRWDGEQTGEDMVEAIAAADPSLYYMSKRGTQYGSNLAGFGYDIDQDGELGVIGRVGLDFAGLVSKPDESGFIDVVDAYTDSDMWEALDADDHHASGWYTGYWSYWTSYETNPFDGGEWNYSPLGMSSLELENGGWQGWSYSNFSEVGSGQAPSDVISAPVLAVPEPASISLLGLGCVLVLCRRNK
ncbi:hypothetical protein KS4_03300 [Poriferisphaera corsica]|uniref:Ice-binding protein C-terminal domain-containing protein n=1 Tax=Poriferisphaera corsica TaxID=2528020 RepID=A0A517YQ01_9BACT|nr:PEP-CTERM sorting domain-containing protein [Poriferisphaera corsica]QDU32298.1 hypothetical protein KS4_03300 [Poriferisphaera corsica]